MASFVRPAMSRAVPRFPCRAPLPGSSSAARESSTHRLGRVSGAQKRDAELRVRLGVVRQQLGALAERVDCPRGIAEKQPRAAQLDERGTHRRLRARGASQVLLGGDDLRVALGRCIVERHVHARHTHAREADVARHAGRSEPIVLLGARQVAELERVVSGSELSGAEAD